MRGMNDLRIVCELIRYQYKQYMRSGKWIVPWIALVGIYSFMYSVAPYKIVNSFSIMGLFLFSVMAWVGVTNQEVEPEVSEQIMVLRVQSERKYYISHILFLGIISVAVTVISIAVPVASHILHGSALFDRKVVWSDFAGGFLLMFSCAFVGTMVGELFHPRIIEEKKIGLGLTFFLALLAIVRNGVIYKYSFSKYILWIVPPVSDVVSWFSNRDYFDMAKAVAGFALLMLYGVILAVIKVELLRKKKF